MSQKEVNRYKYKIRFKVLGRSGSLVGNEECFSIAYSFREALKILKDNDNKSQVVDEAYLQRERRVI